MEERDHRSIAHRNNWGIAWALVREAIGAAASTELLAMIAAEGMYIQNLALPTAVEVAGGVAAYGVARVSMRYFNNKGGKKGSRPAGDFTILGWRRD